MPPQSQDGLRWEHELLDLVPEWTRDPSIAAIEEVCRQELGIPSEEACDVAFHASGLFNKLYTVKGANGPSRIMRVSLPVYPHHKTRAEVATLRWVRDNTSIPVPEVFAFDDSNDNPIGFEWILMELMEGMPAHTRWRGMTMEQKVALTEQMARFQAELSGFGKTESLFRSIGTLDILRVETDGVEEMKGVAPSLMVSPEFFIGDRLHYDNIPRGPFRSSHDWLSAVLGIILRHQTAILETSEDEDDIEDAEKVSSVAQKLLAHLPSVFPLPSPEEPEPESETTALYHHDLHLNNILVDEQGKITAVLDWECVSALPLWVTSIFPKFLEGPVREDQPQRDHYMDAAAAAAAAPAPADDDDDSSSKPHVSTTASAVGDLCLEDEDREKNELYYIHTMEYEATQLRKIYEAKLKELWPEWPLEENLSKVDLFQAISQCDGMWVKQVERWVDRVGKGEKVRFDQS